MAQIEMVQLGRIRPQKHDRVLIDGRPWNYGPQEAMFTDDRQWAYNPKDRQWAYRPKGLGAILDHPFWGPAVIVGGLIAGVAIAAWWLTPPARSTARGRLYMQRMQEI